jgi:hypothetical protein
MHLHAPYPIFQYDSCRLNSISTLVVDALKQSFAAYATPRRFDDHRMQTFFLNFPRRVCFLISAMPPKTLSHGQPETADYVMTGKHHPCPQSIAYWDLEDPSPFTSLPAQFPSSIQLPGTAAHCLLIG